MKCKEIIHKIFSFIKKYFFYIVGGIALVVVGILTISTANKFNTSGLIKSIQEYFFLRSKNAKRKNNTIKTDVGDVDIPDDLQDNTITGIGHTDEYINEDTSSGEMQSGSGTINHTVVDRKNSTPTENSFKKKVDNKK
jgi:hypothetical protein